jgi:hypothetical protein
MSLNLTTNVLDEDYNVYLGDTIDKQRTFQNKKTLEQLSLILLFTQITKGLYENIIRKTENAIYCAENHDIGKVFNDDKFITITKENTEIINFLKKAIRLTNFTECVVITKDNTLIDFKHGNGKNTFETIKKIHKDKTNLITLSKKSKTVYQNKLSKIATDYLNKDTYNGVNEANAPYDICSNWGHIPKQPQDINKNNHLEIFKEITTKDIEQQLALKINSQNNYILFFGHFHGASCNFQDYYLNEKTKISPYIEKSLDNSSLYVFMPPAYHDNRFLTTKKYRRDNKT